MNDFNYRSPKMENQLNLVDINKTKTIVKDIKKNGLHPGLSSGWLGFDRFYSVPPIGQLNVLTGAPQTGKSEWLDSYIINMIVLHKWKVFVYSPENFPPEYHLQKLAEKISGKPFFGNWTGYENISQKEIDQCFKILENHFSFVDTHINNASVDKIIDTILAECLERKIDMAVIDPWNKLESQKPQGVSGTKWVGRELTKIQMFARQHNISFWIVAHPAKPIKLKDGSYAQVTMYDISDSAHWYNMTDNGFILHRTWEDRVNNFLTKMKIAKIKDRRYGHVGEHQFLFEPANGRFGEVDSQYGKTVVQPSF